MHKLSIIMPVYNEEKTVESVIKKVKSVNLENVKKEFIVVDDCSTDKTREILKKMKGVRLFRHRKNQGKGAAIRTGLQHASGDIIIIQDADLEYDPNDYSVIFEPILNKQSSVVFGSRFLSQTGVPSTQHINNHYRGNKFYLLGNKVLSFCITILYRVRITDMETCYKAFRSDVLKKINLTANRFDFEPEITAKILRQGYSIVEVPVKYSPRPFSEGKKITWKDGIKALYCLIKYRFFG
jgi:glycosyltransferase involved in cell wall biosynthesis